MRDALAILEGVKLAVSGTVDAFSNVRGYAGRNDTVICLVDVRSSDREPLCDHVWMRRGRRLRALDLHKGDVVAFTGTVVRYMHVSGDPDYKLVRPYQCRVLDRAAPPAPPEPEPKPAPILTAPAPGTPAKARIVGTIEALAEQLGESPSLPRLCHHCAMAPTSFLHNLNKLTKSGRVAFEPSGRVYLIPTVLEGASL